MHVTRFILPLVALAVLVGFLAAGLGRDPTLVPSPLVGRPSPDFSLPRLDDPTQAFSSTEFRGDVSLLNVWATWCVGCRQEHAYLVELSRTSGLRIFGLNWKDDPVLARRWLADLGNPYVATAVDLDGRVAIDWGVYGAPETFLLDAAGRVLYKHIAPLTPAIWEAEFLPRIQAARSAAP
ncbi:MAG: DsbE family thiol:disulfide interchange protein [Gammaproteobacteria bacterium]|nr:DsbE family thiol:disulfide interchange protein [Gammaproteobacteria bacterium]